jgi:copper(I)-binding protein
MRALLLGMVLITAGCSRPDQLSADKAWIRLPAAADRPAAAYFTLYGGPKDAQLIAVSSDVTVRGELHETATGPGGMMTMRALDRIPVPAGSEVAFRPGGKHVMLYGVPSGLKPHGRSVLLTFTFADGTRVQRRAEVYAAGEAAPE